MFVEPKAVVDPVDVAPRLELMGLVDVGAMEAEGETEDEKTDIRVDGTVELLPAGEADDMAGDIDSELRIEDEALMPEIGEDTDEIVPATLDPTLFEIPEDVITEGGVDDADEIIGLEAEAGVGTEPIEVPSEVEPVTETKIEGYVDDPEGGIADETEVEETAENMVEEESLDEIEAAPVGEPLDGPVEETGEKPMAVLDAGEPVDKSAEVIVGEAVGGRVDEPVTEAGIMTVEKPKDEGLVAKAEEAPADEPVPELATMTVEKLKEAGLVADPDGMTADEIAVEPVVIPRIEVEEEKPADEFGTFVEVALDEPIEEAEEKPLGGTDRIAEDETEETTVGKLLEEPVELEDDGPNGPVGGKTVDEPNEGLELTLERVEVESEPAGEGGYVDEPEESDVRVAEVG